MPIYVRPMRGKRRPDDPAFKVALAHEECIVNVCSTGKPPFSTTLSPFNLGPCEVPWRFPVEDPVTKEISMHWQPCKVFENLWQYMKVYAKHTDPKTGEPTEEWYRWARAGFANPKAVRFPMGRGAKPLYSYGGTRSDGTVKRLGYVEARFEIYALHYAALVKEKYDGISKLRDLLDRHKSLTLLDFDGWNHEARGLTLEQVLYHPGHRCGHGFILAMMLSGTPFWEGEFRGQEGIDEAIAAEKRGPGQQSLKREASSTSSSSASADARAAPRQRVAQPPPVPRGEAVPPVFQEWARANGFTEAADLSVSRAAFGEAKYGQPLMTEDGRDSIEDALDELGDAEHYLQKAIMNGEDVSRLVPHMEAIQALHATGTSTYTKRVAQELISSRANAPKKVYEFFVTTPNGHRSLKIGEKYDDLFDFLYDSTFMFDPDYVEFIDDEDIISRMREYSIDADVPHLVWLADLQSKFTGHVDFGKGYGWHMVDLPLE